MKNTKHRWLRVSTAFAFICACVGAFAAPVKFEALDVAQGFNFKKDVPNKLGFIKYLAVGATELPADLQLAGPLSTASLPRVGVLSNVSWSGEAGDPISFTLNVSTANKQKIADALQKDANSNQVRISFEVLSYDGASQKWYRAFFSPSGLAGLVQKDGNALKLVIGKPGVVATPQYWSIQLAMMPVATQQSVALFNTPATGGPMTWGGAAPIAKSAPAPGLSDPALSANVRKAGDEYEKTMRSIIQAANALEQPVSLSAQSELGTMLSLSFKQSAAEIKKDATVGSNQALSNARKQQAQKTEQKTGQ